MKAPTEVSAPAVPRFPTRRQNKGTCKIMTRAQAADLGLISPDDRKGDAEFPYERRTNWFTEHELMMAFEMAAGYRGKTVLFVYDPEEWRMHCAVYLLRPKSSTSSASSGI